MPHALMALLLLTFWTASLWSAAPIVSPTADPIGFASRCGAVAGKIPKTDAAGIYQCSDDAGATTGAPTDSQYWLGAADGTLSAEKNLGALTTGLVLNTAGVPSTKAANTCTNQFPRSDNASGVWTCASVGTADVTDGTLTDADMAAANKDGVAGTPSLRTLGGGAQQAAGGSDARFPTTDEKAALVGTSGTAVSASNKLVDSADTRLASMVTPSTLSAASQITCATPTVYVAGSGGAVTLTSNPSMIAGTYNGQRCLLVGSHATNTVTLSNGNTIRLPGNTGTITIGLNLGSPEFIWTGAEWVLASLPLQMAKQTGPVVTMTTCGNATNQVIDGGSGNQIEFCLTGTTPTLKMLCSGVTCTQTAITNMVLAISGAKPTCDATLAPTDTLPMWVVTGGAGVATAFQVCSKNALDVYAWRSITLP